MFCRYLRGNKDFFPADTASADAFADSSFVAVCLCGINVAVSHFYGIHYHICHLVIGYQPGTKRKLRDFHTIV